MQNVELIIRGATLISVIVGIITLYVGVSRFKRQMNAQVFIEYTKRFDQVVSSFPAGAWCARRNVAEELPPPDLALKTACLRYLNLCAEELYLRSQRYLTDKVWRIWEVELERTLRSSLFVREWQTLRAEFDAYPDFREYVDQTMRRNLK